MRVDVSYSLQGEEAAGTVSVEAGGSTLQYTPEPTGQTVGEPNQDWHIDNFASRRMGVLAFREAGVYEVALSVVAAPGHPVKFQWLWLRREDVPAAASSPE